MSRTSDRPGNGLFWGAALGAAVAFDTRDTIDRIAIC
jgi:hypothetical protein